jgi:hypothetical protein
VTELIGAAEEFAPPMSTTDARRLPVVPDLQPWCRIVVVGADGRVVVEHVLEGRGSPGLDAVAFVAQAALLATRRGGAVVLRDVSAAMQDLLSLAGLRARLLLETEREAERGEQALVVERGEEELQTRDPPA